MKTFSKTNTEAFDAYTHKYLANTFQKTYKDALSKVLKRNIQLRNT